MQFLLFISIQQVHNNNNNMQKKQPRSYERGFAIYYGRVIHAEEGALYLYFRGVYKVLLLTPWSFRQSPIYL